MKKIVVFSFLALSLFASDEYIPVSELSHSKKQEYNFVNKTNINKALEEQTHTTAPQESDDVIAPLEKLEIKETKVNISENAKEKKEVITNTKVENKTFVKEYKNENILKDELKYSDNSFSKDFSVTPKISYMNVTTSVDKLNINNKSHEIVPEFSLTYKKEHTIKADYFNVKDEDFDTNWYRIAYLYKFLNANIGLAFNSLTVKGADIEDEKDNEKFATIELHLKNSQDQLQVEYGGFYGKNSVNITSAYEYYLTLAYKIFNNDNLIINAGYKNRTVENDDGNIIEYKGPTLGISSTF
jgi:hypothetical protein